ncbi:alpha-hydroxy-acid oxidizing protein [Nocardia sp. NPDC055029]
MLGARAVLVGRAYAWAVAARREAGAQRVALRIPCNTAVGLVARASVKDLSRRTLELPALCCYARPQFFRPTATAVRRRVHIPARNAARGCGSGVT